MFDSLILAMLESALNSVAHFSRTEYPTFQDSNVRFSAIAAHTSKEGCVVYTDPLTNAVLRVELPSPLSPDYDYCYAHLTGTQFNG